MDWIWIVFGFFAGAFVLAILFVLIRRFFYLHNLESGSRCKFWIDEVAVRGTVTEIKGSGVLIEYRGSVYKRPMSEIAWP